MDYEMKTTPSYITYLEPNQIFVFGSNTAGIHGAGAAKTAHTLFGAKYGVGLGMTGKCYAIPTKDHNLETLPLPRINKEVKRFLEYATFQKHLEFLVTPIGCGLAGYEPKDIAPMFKDAPKNVILPESFVHMLNKLNPENQQP